MSESKGRFQYIKRGIVGMAAATLLTGVVAAPAFAAGSDASGQGSPFNAAGSGTSKVEATIDDAQVTATVPTSLPVVIGADGAFSTADNAAIHNTSVFNIHVSSITASPSSGMSLKALDYAALPGDKDVVGMTVTSGATGGTAFDLAAGSFDSVKTQWAVDANGTLAFKYAGKMQNISKISTLPMELLTVTWTIAPGDGTVTA